MTYPQTVDITVSVVSPGDSLAFAISTSGVSGTGEDPTLKVTPSWVNYNFDSTAVSAGWLFTGAGKATDDAGATTQILLVQESGTQTTLPPNAIVNLEEPATSLQLKSLVTEEVQVAFTLAYQKEGSMLMLHDPQVTNDPDTN